MATSITPSTNVDALMKRISGEHDTLSKQLKVIALYCERHKSHIGIEGIQHIANQCQVQPSAIIRFAKHFGYSGFSEMQAIFREGLTRQLAAPRSYQSRIQEVISTSPKRLAGDQIADAFLKDSIAGLQELQQDLHGPTFKKAVKLLTACDSIWICAARRSFPIAVYLDYALQHTEKRIGLISGLGNMQAGHIRSIRAGDVLLAISFAPYAAETMQTVKAARERGALVVAMTDSKMSPLAKLADATLVVQDSSTLGFRSLASSMALAQSLFMALAYALELPHKSTSETGQIH